MAEGPTVARWADQLQPLIGEPLLRADAPRRLQDRAQMLLGHHLTGIESRGKNLILHVSDGTVIRCHAMMFGSWQIGEPGMELRKPESRIRLRLVTPHHEAAFFSGPVVEFMTEQEAAVHPTLSTLGPDLLDPSFDREEAWRRLQLHPDLTIAEALLDQTIVAGIGNIWKSEGLYLAALDPRRPVRDISRAEMERLWDLLIPLMQESRRTGRIDTVPPDRRSPGLWRLVYGRTGRPCLDCDGVVKQIAQGAGRRRTYFCEACQH